MKPTARKMTWYSEMTTSDCKVAKVTRATIAQNLWLLVLVEGWYIIYGPRLEVNRVKIFLSKAGIITCTAPELLHHDCESLDIISRSSSKCG